jgi:hypothetical protein
VENGFLTANGKLKRNAIEQRYQEQIEDMYRQKESVVRSQ